MHVKGATLTLSNGHNDVAGRRVEVVALFCDLRGFSNWCETVNIDEVDALMRTQFERVIQICNDHHHDFHKFLGDGFVLVWESSHEVSLRTCLARALDAAFELHKKYWYLAQDHENTVPAGYGIGIAAGEAVLLQPRTILAELNQIDFVGYPLNCAARLQTLAGAYGTVLSATVVDLVRGDGASLLYNEVPGFRRLLLAPEDVGLAKASTMKGLRERDRNEYQHLVFEVGFLKLWKTTGVPAT